jgi:hypothetical protein
MKKRRILGILLLLTALGGTSVYTSLQQDELSADQLLEMIKMDGPTEISAGGAWVTPVQYFADSYAPEAVLELMKLGYSASSVTTENTHLPLDICLQSLQFLQLGQDADGPEYSSLKTLDILLQHGALPGERSRDLLPIDDKLRNEVLAVFEKHGINLLSGADVCNDCCPAE